MQSNDLEKITPEQLRAGRALLKMSAEKLAEIARVGVATVRRAENSLGESNHSKLVDYALRRALEDAGVEFLPESEGGGPGVRVSKRGTAPEAE